jgi:hypothetical protein
MSKTALCGLCIGMKRLQKIFYYKSAAAESTNQVFPSMQKFQHTLFPMGTCGNGL